MTSAAARIAARNPLPGRAARTCTGGWEAAMALELSRLFPVARNFLFHGRLGSRSGTGFEPPATNQRLTTFTPFRAANNVSRILTPSQKEPTND
jgi:hypothetical protein